MTREQIDAWGNNKESVRLWMVQQSIGAEYSRKMQSFQCRRGREVREDDNPWGDLATRFLEESLSDIEPAV